MGLYVCVCVCVREREREYHNDSRLRVSQMGGFSSLGNDLVFIYLEFLVFQESQVLNTTYYFL